MEYLARMATNVAGDMFVQMDPNASTLAKANVGLKESLCILISHRNIFCALKIF